MSVELLTHVFYTVVPFAVVLSVLIFVHEFGHFWVARRCGVRVEKFSIGFGKEIFGWTRGETRYSIGAVPFGGFVKMAGEAPTEKRVGKPWEYYSQSIWRRILIVSAGPAVNYVTGFALLFCLYMVGNPKMPAMVGFLTKGYPAIQAGLKVGDRIVSVDGKGIRSFSDIIFSVQGKLEGPIQLVVERDDEMRVFSVTPLIEPGVDRFGRQGDVARIGVGPSDKIVQERYRFTKAAQYAFRDTLFLTTTTYQGLWYLVTGQVEFRKSVTGPVGILVITAETARLGILHLLQFMALISIALAIFNFLPIPVLDGGHVMFLLYEKIRGRPLGMRIQENIQQVAFALLLTLILVVSVNDFINFRVVERFMDWLPLEK